MKLTPTRADRAGRRESPSCFERIRLLPAEAFVAAFSLRSLGARHACPACGGPFEVINIRDGYGPPPQGVSGCCFNHNCKLCGLGPNGAGWPEVIGARLWGYSWEAAAEHILAKVPDHLREEVPARRGTPRRLPSRAEARKILAAFLAQ